MKPETHLPVRHTIDRCTRLWLLMVFGWLAGAPTLVAQSDYAKEYQIKAVFLYNFAQFVEWPDESFPDAQSSLVIGVLGDDPFGAELDEIVRGELVNNRPLVVQRFRTVEEIKTCHILFISDSESEKLNQILTELKGKHILTVSDTSGFARLGGMIRFVTENNTIRMRINVEATKAADLTISSKLLRAAQIVTESGN